MSEAVLDIQFTSTGADVAVNKLDAVADKAGKAEVATDKFAAGNKRAGGAVAQMVASIERSLAQLVALQRAQGAAAGSAHGLADATGHAVREQEALIRTAGRLNAVHGSAVASTKAVQQATLNMTRQFADVGVQLAGGTPAWLVLVQQGPQIADGFQLAAQQGLNFKAVMAGLYAQAAPLLAVLGPIAVVAGALGSVFALSARQINEENKNLASGLGLTADQLEKVKNKTVTMGDVAVGTFNAAKGALASAFGDELKAAGNAIDKFFGDLSANTVKETKAIVGAFMGAFEAVKATWSMLPGAFGDATVRAAQAALDALAKLVNGAIGLINPVLGGLNDRFKLGLPQLDKVSFSKLRNEYEGQMSATAKAGAEAFARGNEAGGALVEKALAAIESETLKAAEKRIRAEAGKAKAVRDTVSEYEKALKASQEYLRGLSEEVATMGMSTEQLKRREVAMKAALAPTEALARAIRIAGGNWEYQTGVMKAHEAQTKSVAAAANDNIKTMAQVLGSVEMDTALDGLIYDLDAIQRQSDLARNAVDDIYYGIRNRDWVGAFSGLLKTIDQLKIAFDGAAKAKDRMAAAAGVAQGVGNAIGGTAGNAISGAAGGAMAGFTLAGPVGAVVGGILGGISSLFGSSKANKQEKAEAEARRLAEEQARLQAVANEARSLEIQKIELTFGALAAEVARREDVLKAMDATNQAAQKEVWALQDAAAAKARDEAVAAEAAQRASDIAATRRDLEIQLLEAQDKASEAAKMRLADERALLDESLQNLFDQVQAERELTAARNEAAAAAEIAAQAEADRVAAISKAAADLRTAQQSDAANLLAGARASLKAAHDAQVSEIKAGRDQMAGYAASFREFRLGLSGAADASASFYAIAAKARLGDTDAMGQLVGAAQAASSSAMSGASTQVEFLREQARIRAAVQAAEDTATRHITVADKQLLALEAQVAGFITVNESVLTVAQGISGVISAINVLNGTFGGVVANANRSWGANPDANMALARQGYSGDFGGGGFQAWAVQQDETTKAKLRDILMQQGQAYRIAFNTGGSFTVGGNGGVDTTPVSFMGTRNEIVNVSKEDVMGALLAETRALRADVKALLDPARSTAANTSKTAGILNDATRGGDSMLVEIAA